MVSEIEPVVVEPTLEIQKEIITVDPIPTEEIVLKETITENIESMDLLSREEGIPIIVKISHYNPSLGGPNCARFENGECLSKLSNGERWQDYWGKYNTIACPPELAFGTVILLDDNEFTCRDRGGAIVTTWEGYYWIDILAESVPYSYGELRKAIIK